MEKKLKVTFMLQFLYEVTYLQMMPHHVPLFNTTVVTPLQCFQGWWNLHDLRWFVDQVLPVCKAFGQATSKKSNDVEVWRCGLRFCVNQGVLVTSRVGWKLELCDWSHDHYIFVNWGN